MEDLRFVKLARIFLGTLALLTSMARANDVQLSLLETDASEQLYYSLNIREIKLREIAAIDGTQLAQTQKYSSNNGKLVTNGIALATADEILFQCEVDGVDLVVVRDEYNSFLGPLKLLYAISGHPVQVSKIVLLVIVNNVVASEREIIRKESAYRWLVGIYK